MTPEQMEALKEKIKNMSPEELREFQKKQCIFCHIISGKVQAKKVYEDSKTLAILDINPANPGHILLLPKEHYAIFPQMPDEELDHISMVAKALSNAVLKTLEATGTNIVIANGPAAGQKAQHSMVHIIPRKEEDNIKFELPQKTIAENELETIRKKLSERLSSMLGKKELKEEIREEIKPVPIPKITTPQNKIETVKKIEPKNKIAEHKEEEKKPKKQKETKPAKEKKADLDDIARVLGIK